MGLEVGLLEPLTGPAGQHARAVRVEPEERGDLARRLVLDLGVPQHGLPPLGQRPEGPHRHRLLGLVHGPHVGAQVERVVVGHLRHPRGLRREHREVVHELLALRRLRPVRGDPADGGQQIRAYGVLGPRTAAHRLEHPGEDLGGQIVGGVRVPAAGTGVPAHGVRVAPVQLLVRRVVTGAHPLDQRGVGGGHLPRRQRRRQNTALTLRRDAALVRVAPVRNGTTVRYGTPVRNGTAGSTLTGHLW